MTLDWHCVPVRVLGERGIHARPAFTLSSKVLEHIKQGGGDVLLAYDGREADASSPLSILLYAIPSGAHVEFKIAPQGDYVDLGNGIKDYLESRSY